MKLRTIRLAILAATAILATGFLFGKGAGLDPGARAPELQAGPWLNSPPLKLANLRGKVVLLKMWTFG